MLLCTMGISEKDFSYKISIKSFCKLLLRVSFKICFNSLFDFSLSVLLVLYLELGMLLVQIMDMICLVLTFLSSELYLRQ